MSTPWWDMEASSPALLLGSASANLAVSSVMLAFTALYPWTTGPQRRLPFGWLSFTAVLFSALYLLTAVTPPSERTLFVPHLVLAVGALHAAGWPIYVARQSGRPLSIPERLASLSALVVALAALVPGLVYERAPLRPVSPTNHLHPFGATPAASVVGVLLLVPFLVVARRYLQELRAKEPGARVRVAGLLAFVLSSGNDILADLGLHRGPSLVHFGSLCLLGTLAIDITRDVAARAARFRQVSVELEGLVKARNEELAQMRASLVRTERLALTGQMIAIVGHELNNPLTSVVTNLHVALSDPHLKPGEAVTEALRDAEQGAVRMQSIVQELRAQARPLPEDGPASSDVPGVVEGSVRMLRPLLRGREMIDVAVDPSWVALEPSRLGQVLTNLLQNALLASRGAASHRVEVHGRVEDAEYVLAVEDRGVGMTEETQARIFEPFFTTREGEGTGLGMFVTESIVRGAGGSIQVRSKLSEGTRVEVRLPTVAPGRSRTSWPDPVAAEPAKAPEGVRVLVVDDDELIRRSFARLLSWCEVVTAGSASEALSLLEGARPFDAIICDLMMPERSGAELYAESVARWPALSSRFVFVTGGATTAETSALVAEHRARVLHKPVTGQQLRSRVTEIAERERAAAHIAADG